MNKILQKNSRLIYLIIATFLFCLLVGSSFRATAQMNEEQEWQSPLNLSRTGAITSPLALMDAAGAFHVFWQDDQAGYVYTTGDDTIWTPPQALNLPFSEPAFTNPSDLTFDSLYTPVLAADQNNVVHAFWVDVNGALLYSRAPVAGLALADGWISPQRVAESAIGQDVIVGVDGRLHLTYIRPQNTPEFPAGVYYRQSVDGGLTWSPPTLLYESTFFRSVAPANAHVRIAAGGTTRPGRAPAATDNDSVSQEVQDTNNEGDVTIGEGGEAVFPEHVHVVVTNPVLDSVFAMRSTDGGATWHTPVVIDSRRPDDNIEANGPSGIHVALAGDEVHLSWWAGHFETPTQCAVYHQKSTDLGATWQSPIVAFEDRLECPVDSRLLLSSDGVLFLLTVLSDRVVLQAWDGLQWSEPILQDILAKFLDPETFREVALDCRQPVTTNDNRLVVVGCGSSYGQDVWIVARSLGAISDWSSMFRPTPVWSQPLPIASSINRLLSPVMVVGADGRLHAFWSQSSIPVVPGRLEPPVTASGNTIFYSRLDEVQWLESRAVLTLPQGGRTAQPAVAAGPDGSMLALWSNSEGRLYYSRAVAERALSVVEWMHPAPVSLPDIEANWPDLIVDEAGTFYLAYAVPLNEMRGIYVTYSDDRGDTWSEPIRAFDGAAAEWQVVGAPNLTRSYDGQMHLLFTHNTLSADGRVLSLAYTHSEDNGRTWTSPETVTEANTLWYGVAVAGDRTVHRVWVDGVDNQTRLWHQFSLDHGMTWSAPLRVSEPDTITGPTTLVLDMARQPHLLQLVESSNNLLLLQEWVWENERWLPGENLNLGQVPIEMNSLEAIARPDGHLAVLYGSFFKNGETDELQDGLFYTSYLLPPPAAQPTPLPTFTPTPQPSPTATPELEPLPTPTLPLPDLSPEEISTEEGGINSLIISVLPAGLIVLVAVVVSLRFVRRN